MWFSRFPVLPGSVEAQVIWGGIVKRLLIAYFIGNISAKKCQNPFTRVKVIASQRWDVFWDTVYLQMSHRVTEEFIDVSVRTVQTFHSTDYTDTDTVQ